MPLCIGVSPTHSGVPYDEVCCLVPDNLSVVMWSESGAAYWEVVFIPLLPMLVVVMHLVLGIEYQLFGVLVDGSPMWQVGKSLLSQLVEFVAVLGLCQFDSVSLHPAVLMGVNVCQRNRLGGQRHGSLRFERHRSSCGFLLFLTLFFLDCLDRLFFGFCGFLLCRVIGVHFVRCSQSSFEEIGLAFVLFLFSQFLCHWFLHEIF